MWLQSQRAPCRRVAATGIKRASEPASVSIEFWVVPEYPLLVEFEAAAAVQIGANARTLRNPLVQRRDAWNLGKNCLCPSRKSVEQAFDGLEER